MPATPMWNTRGATANRRQRKTRQTATHGPKGPRHPHTGTERSATIHRNGLVCRFRVGAFAVSDDALCGFVDESKKPVRDPRTRKVSTAGEFYVVAAAVVLRGDLDDTRRQLEDLASELGAELHYNELSPARRLQAVDGIAKMGIWDGYLFETAKPFSPRHNSERRARAHTMSAAFRVLGGTEGVQRLVLETRGNPSMGFTLDEHDHRTLQSLRDKNQVPHALSISHGTKAEPLLWLADVVAGARTDHLCNVNSDVYPLIGHRVRATHQVLGN